MAPDARAARERKQKIFVVVGGLALVLLLALQLPRFLGGSSSSAAALPEETTFAGDQTRPAPSRAARVVLIDTDRRGGTAPGKLTSFTVFSRKDPFIQQVVTQTPLGDAGGAGGKEGAAKTTSKGFSVEDTAAAVTIISVNGARQALEPGAAFPASDPVFVLVAERPSSKTAVIGIAGGAYASGAKTTKLKVGKPLVLVNTTTGARYRIVLVAVGSDSASSQAAPGKDAAKAAP